MLKLDANGNKLWGRRYQNATRGQRFFNVVEDTINNHYILVGYSYDSLYASLHIEIADTSGHILSAYDYTDSSLAELYPSSLNSIITSNGNLLLAGYAYPYSASFIMMCDLSGNILWSKLHQDTILQSENSNYILLETPGNKLVAINFYNSPVLMNADLEISKFDLSGNLIWTRAFGMTSFHFSPWSSFVDADENIYVSGYIQDWATGNDYRGFFIKLDSSGNLLQSLQYFAQAGCGMELNFLTSHNSIFTTFYKGMVGNSLPAISMLDTAGNILSTATAMDNPAGDNFGGYIEMNDGGVAAISIRNLADSNYRYCVPYLKLDSTYTFPCFSLTVNITDSALIVDVDSVYPSYIDFNLFKVPTTTTELQIGQQEIECSLTTANDLQKPEGRLDIFPNPVSNQLHFILQDNQDYRTIKICNTQGMYISITNTKKNVIEVSNLSPGLYLLEIFSGNRIYRTRFIKE